MCEFASKKGKRKVQWVPQSQTAALPRPPEKEETDKSKALLQLANFTLGPDATLNTEIHKNSVRIKAPNSVNASKRKQKKNQTIHYNKQRRVLMTNSTVCQSKWKPIVEQSRAFCSWESGSLFKTEQVFGQVTLSWTYILQLNKQPW